MVDKLKIINGSTHMKRYIATETRRKELEHATQNFEDYWCSVPEGNPSLTDYLMTFIFFFCMPIFTILMLITTVGI